MLDEPVNGLDPEGIHWIRNLLKRLAAEGRTVFVSSHLMSEMSMTADHLIVIGRGKLIADTSVDEFVAQASAKIVLVRSPELVTFATAARGTGRHVRGGRARSARGSRAERRRRSATRLRRNGIAIHELTPQQASLEEAFMSLTSSEVEFASLCRHGSGGARERARPRAAPALERHRARDAAARLSVRVDEAALGPLDQAGRSLAAFVFTIGLPAIAATVVSHHWPHMSPHDRADFHPLDVSLVGVQLAQLAVGVLGVLVITAEYSTGMIRASMTAVPRRLPVLWGKAAVYALTTVALMTPAVVIGFFVSQWILSHRHIDIAFTAAGVPRAVLGAGLYLTVIGAVRISASARSFATRPAASPRSRR